MSTTTIHKPPVPTDFEVRSPDLPLVQSEKGVLSYSKYLLMGMFFGFVLVKSEVISWYRIQEMFRLQSFHMYGVLGTAVATGIISVWLIKRWGIKTIKGEPIILPVRQFHKGVIYGGLLFGSGWAITGACPGPLFAQIGSGFTIVTITLLSAVAGTWLYGRLRDRLPH